MKKKLLASCVFLYMNFAIAQNGKYIPFPSEMIVYTYENNGRSDKGWFSSSRFELYGDTLINGLHYSKYFLAQANKNAATNFPTSDLAKLNILTGGIRNDIPAKKVYLYSFTTKKEELLYDFDLHVGDTLFKNDGYRFYRSLLGDEFDPKIDTVWVSRIDSVLLPHDNLYHKRFNFKTKYRVYKHVPYDDITSDSLCGGYGYGLKIDPLIEGIGPDINPISGYGHFEYGYRYSLFCRSVNKKIAYADFGGTPPPFMSKTNCNSIITEIDDEKENISVILYPNPSNGKFNIKTVGSQLKFFELNNLLGVKIISSMIENNKAEIDISSQPSGVYFIRFFDKNGASVIRKIIVE